MGTGVILGRPAAPRWPGTRQSQGPDEAFDRDAILVGPTGDPGRADVGANRACGPARPMLMR
jgi:hypothetical protein